MSKNAENQRAVNHAAYERLKPEIDKGYAPGQYVAIHGGHIVADSVTFEGLYDTVTELKTHPEEVMVVQAGVDYPKEVTLFLATKVRPC